MEHSEIRVSINRPLSEVFAIYTQTDTWQRAGLRKVRWTLGRPWEVGSRLRFEPSNAYGVICDQVLTRFEPNTRVDFINHFGGITLQAQLTFRAVSGDVTEVCSQLEFIGIFSRMAEYPLRSAIEKGAQRFYEHLKRECEWRPT
jgi:hypothetical protein